MNRAAYFAVAALAAYAALGTASAQAAPLEWVDMLHEYRDDGLITHAEWRTAIGYLERAGVADIVTYSLGYDPDVEFEDEYDLSYVHAYSDAFETAVDHWESLNPQLLFIRSDGPDIQVTRVEGIRVPGGSGFIRSDGPDVKVTVHGSVPGAAMEACSKYEEADCRQHLDDVVYDCTGKPVLRGTEYAVGAFAHMIGHALGMGHSQDKSHVMHGADGAPHFDDLGYAVPGPFVDWYAEREETRSKASDLKARLDWLSAEREKMKEYLQILDDNVEDLDDAYGALTDKYASYDGRELTELERVETARLLEEIKEIDERRDSASAEHYETLATYEGIVREFLDARDGYSEPPKEYGCVTSAERTKRWVTAIDVPGKGRIVYADIPTLPNAGGFWYPITVEQAKNMMEIVTAVTDRGIRLAAIPHPYLPNHAYYDAPYQTCYYMDNGYCLSKSHFLVSYGSSSEITSVKYRLGAVVWDDDERLGVLRDVADTIGFDIKREDPYAVYAADGSRMTAHAAFLGSGGSPRGDSTEIVIGGWSNESDWPRLIPDHELAKIAKEFTARNIDIIDPMKCRHFILDDSISQNDQHDDDGLTVLNEGTGAGYKYMNGGIPVLRVAVGSCEDPLLSGMQPPEYVSLHANIDRLTGKVVYFEQLWFLVDDWIREVDLPDKYKVISE